MPSCGEMIFRKRDQALKDCCYFVSNRGKQPVSGYKCKRLDEPDC